MFHVKGSSKRPNHLTCLNQLGVLGQVPFRILGHAGVGPEVRLLDVGDPELGAVVEDPDVVGRDHLGSTLEPVDQGLRNASGLKESMDK